VGERLVHAMCAAPLGCVAVDHGHEPCPGRCLALPGQAPANPAALEALEAVRDQHYVPREVGRFADQAPATPAEAAPVPAPSVASPAAGGVLGPRWTPGGLADRMSRLVFAVDAFNRDAVRAYADEAETLACERVEALDMLSTITELLGATGDADALVEHVQVALADYTIAAEDARHLRADALATRAALGLAPEATTAEVVAAIGALRVCRITSTGSR
jgi:hypothetical protein